MQVERLEPAYVVAVCQTHELSPGVVKIEGLSIGICADHNVRRRFENGSEPGVRGLGALALANLPLQRGYLLPQFDLGALQSAVLGLDLREHLIERVGQDAN